MQRKSASYKTSKRKRTKKQATPERARFLIDQCPHRITGEVNIPGLQLLPPEHESELERTAIHLFACCWDVQAIVSQPVRITFDGGRSGRYTADLRLTMETGEHLRIEVKPLQKCLSPEMRDRLILVAQHFLQNHESFQILTDDAICQQPRLSIAIRLRGFLKQVVQEDLWAIVIPALQSGAKKVCQLLPLLGGDQSWGGLVALIAHRRLCISWCEPFSKEMLVSLPHRPFPPLTYAALASSSRFHPLVQELALGRRPSDQRLLAAAIVKDNSVSLPDAFGAVGPLPKRSMQVNRAFGSCRTGANGNATAAGSFSSANDDIC